MWECWARWGGGGILPPIPRFQHRCSSVFLRGGGRDGTGRERKERKVPTGSILNFSDVFKRGERGRRGGTFWAKKTGKDCSERNKKSWKHLVVLFEAISQVKQKEKHKRKIGPSCLGEYLTLLDFKKLSMYVSKPDLCARRYLVFLSLAALDPIPGWCRSSGMSPLRSFFPRQKNMR